MISSSLVVLVLASSMAWLGQVDSICFELTKQYFECYLLNMTLVDEGWRQYYAPDPSVENNYLDDSIYEWFLSDFSLEDGLDLMRSINEQIANCDSEVCECIKKRKAYSYANDETYAPFFDSEDHFADVKSIISSLDTALESDRIAAEDLQNQWGFGNDENLTSLTGFCAKAEYSSLRSNIYNNYYSCYTYDNSVWSTCDYYMKVDSDKREALIEFDEEARGRALVCQSIGMINCLYEQQIFNALTLLVESYARPEQSPGESLLASAEGLVAQVNNIPLDDLYDTAYFALSSDSVYYKSFNAGYGYANLSSIGSSFSFLSAPELNVNVDCEIGLGENDLPIIANLIVTVNDEEAGGINQFTLNTNTDDLLNITLTNSQDVNILQIVSFQYDYSNLINVYDFNAKYIITFYNSYVTVLAPRSLIDQSTGFLVDGPPQNEDQVENGEENKPVCKEICQKINEIMKSSSSANNERCLKSC